MGTYTEIHHKQISKAKKKRNLKAAKLKNLIQLSADFSLEMLEAKGSWVTCKMLKNNIKLSSKNCISILPKEGSFR